jgi:hypothetical protein
MEGLNWIHLALDGEKWCASENSILIHFFQKMWGI